MSHDAERREYLRAGLSVFVNEESRTARNLARAVDISERGLHYLMPADSPLLDTGEVTLEFSLPNQDEPVRALAQVVHSSAGDRVRRTAVQFTMIQSGDASRIRHYVGERKRAEFFEELREQHLLH